MPARFPDDTGDAGGAIVPIHVVPRAGKNEVVGRHGDSIKIRLMAPAVEGAANHALVLYLAIRLGVSRQQVEIVGGTFSRDKLVRVTGLTREDVERRLTLQAAGTNGTRTLRSASKETRD